MRVYVSRGELVQMCETVDGVSYNLAFPLTCADGSPAIGDYRGEGSIVERHGGTVLLIEVGCTIAEYEIGEATKEEHERADGFVFGMRQKKMVAPKKKSDAFVDGWRSAWFERN